METHPLIGESAHYLWIAPLGATMAWQQWIVPKAHAPEMDEPHGLASRDLNGRRLERVPARDDLHFVNWLIRRGDATNKEPL